MSPTTLTSTLHGAPPAKPARVGSILAMLTPLERRHFLPPEHEHTLNGLSEHIVIVDPTDLTPAQWNDLLHEHDPEVLIACWKTPPLPAKLPPSLRYLCYLAGSIKHLVTPAHLDQGLIVTNWGGSISRIVAEWTLFHILSCLRRATQWTLAMHTEGAWKNPETETASLFGRRIGIHGFGMVARELVKILQPFGNAISVFAPDVTPAVEKRHHVRAAASLDDLFRNNDIVIELAPLIPCTENSVTEHHLRLLKPGGVFVNLGRGAVVEQAGLLRVAREGNIFIGLDVFVEEPLPPDSPFRGLRNVCLTPHLAGPTTDRRRDATAFGLRNLAAYAEGRPLEAQITTEIYAQIT